MQVGRQIRSEKKIIKKKMDQRRLVDFVKQIPQLWDRNCPTFRDKDAKDRGWEEVGRKMDQPSTYNV